MGIRNSVTVDLGLDINKILLVGLLVFTLVGSIGLYLPENLAFADEHDNKDKKDKEKKVKDKEQIQENTANIETMSADFDLFKLIAAELNKLITNMNNYIEDLELKIAGVEGELQKEIEAREASEAAFKAEIDAMKSSGDIDSTTVGGGGSFDLGISSIQEPGKPESPGVKTYSNTISGIIGSNSGDIVTATCEPGDLVISGNHQVMYADSSFIILYESEAEGMDVWEVPAWNTHPTDDIQIDVTVDCLVIRNTKDLESVTKAGLG